ncbi:hypothetical protein D3C75_711090 [compost metagenome]
MVFSPGKRRWMEVICTITPYRCLSIGGSKPRSKRIAANRLVSKASCQSASLWARTPPVGAEEPPTLFTRMSTPPNRSRISLTNPVVPSGVLMSAGMNISGALNSSGLVRAVVITAAPASESRFTMASPIPPFVPPVTSTRLPANSFSIIIFSPPILHKFWLPSPRSPLYR